MKATVTAEEALKDFKVLEEIGKDENLSQRDLAGRIGLALGHTNQVVKRLIKKGMVKTSKVNAKRVAYYLTPKGFSEKIRLVMEYAEYTVSFFAAVREGVTARLRELMALHNVQTVALVGTGELAEAAYLSIQELNLKLVDVVSTESKSCEQWFGIDVKRPSMCKENGADVVIVTHRIDSQDHLNSIEAAGSHIVHIHELLSESINLFANRIASEE